MKKRPIDIKRESALTVELSDSDDPSPIRKIKSIEGRLYCIKDRSVFLARLADDIDPERTNIAVSPIHRKELNYGFTDKTVQRTLLLAIELFNKTHLGSESCCETAMNLSLEAAKSLIEMREIHESLSETIQDALDKGLEPDIGRSQKIPSISNLNSDAIRFVRIAAQFRKNTIELIKLFYKVPAGKKVTENINQALIEKHGENSDIEIFFKECEPVLELLRNFRNADEHPKENNKLVVLDFEPGTDLLIAPPTIELINSETPVPRTNILSYTNQTLELLTDLWESLIIHICAHNLKPFGVFEVGIIKLDEKTRKARGIRFSYGINLNGNWQLMG